ncbi:uncharacterized protein LOC119838152 [Zerene cesonia]|uniref:uncharacterized protein LOC119838152 n=1 Tax=Zerene cesonia TaxID=33412 RepID=UPI0018E559D2|nr:uncharacterized protein LOC119838152 [Zerene cesonia]
MSPAQSVNVRMSNNHAIMSEAELFTVSLIDAVKKRPVLYDVNHEGGGNKNMEKHTAWSDIATELQENENVVKKRWKGLKECYVKYKKSRSLNYSNPTYDQYRNWRWASYLEFMEPHLKGLRNVEDSSLNVEDYVYEEESSKEEENETNIFDDSANNIGSVSDVASPKNSPSLNVQQVNNVEPADDIHYLFLSYAETIRKLPPKKQILIKLEMAKLFSKAEMESLDNKDIFDS